MHPFVRAACLTVLLSSSAAWADIVFSIGNNPQPGQQNVLFNNAGDLSGPANLVRGNLNQTTTTHVDFTSSTALTTPSNGQARIEGAVTMFTDLSIFLTVPPGGTYTSLIFNINSVGNTGDVTLTAVEGNGQVNVAPLFGLSNGENFFTVVAINGQNIRQVNISTTVGIEDVKQVRIGGVQLAAVPEPSSILLFGTMLAGVSYLLKGKHKSRSV